ncbi:hypothetical protein HDG32_005333 [Paraburkholderia sp. CI2]|uniref:hypothetical protein n=1 Tax=Paraburkholderia sp. CI2 TaxID=2723093 RepID=UPI0016160A13|nr:hypothetical protein [Paraburkholderia sp. CI2]MBB5469186.1 hypothetical protein [Paraburkholderia sp. CI2]
MKTYTPVGRCIYCGSKERLSKEHIIPAGLRGDMILPRSSCEKCAGITSSYEGHIQRGIWALFRRNKGIGSGRHKETDFSALSIQAVRAGVSSKLTGVEAGLPSSFISLSLPLPTLISAVPVGDTWPAMACNLHHFEDEREMPKPSFEQVTIRYGLSPKYFCALFAKIAYSFAVAECGVDGFIPLVQPLCLLKEREAWQYVGREWTTLMWPSELDGAMHKLQIRNESGFVIVTVQLFAPFNFPPYAVVVGRSLVYGSRNWPET